MMDRTKYAIPDIQEPEPAVCLRCGALVVRQNVHTNWHRVQDNVKAAAYEAVQGLYCG
jgi:hypothetical protein